MSDFDPAAEYADMDSLVVHAAHTGNALFDIDGEPTPFTQLRAFTVDGEEHNLLLHPSIGLPLISAISETAMHPYAHMMNRGQYGDIPDAPEDINWDEYKDIGSDGDPS